MTTPSADDITDAIAENATGPKSATVDGNSFTQHAIQDQILARNDAAAQGAAAQPHFGLRMSVQVPPGCG